MPRPLEGLTVLDLTRLLPGPFATLLLADLGATIIKVEAPRGGDYARWFPPLGGRMAAVLRRLRACLAPGGALLFRKRLGALLLDGLACGPLLGQRGALALGRVGIAPDHDGD